MRILRVAFLRSRSASLLLLLLAISIAGCGGNSDSSDGVSPAPTAPTHLTLGPCNSAADNEVVTATGMSTLTRVVTSPIGCQWEAGPASNLSVVRTWWYRGTSIEVERSHDLAARQQVADVKVGPLIGFSARVGADRCEVYLADVPDVVSWSVEFAGPPHADACDAATGLAQLSVDRGAQ